MSHFSGRVGCLDASLCADVKLYVSSSGCLYVTSLQLAIFTQTQRLSYLDNISHYSNVHAL